MRVCDYIARRLVKAGIKKAFLVQGAANNDIIFSLADTPGIDYICGQHEQACGFMAEGYAKVTGGLGFACATSGPGGQNLTTSIANCFYDSVPVLFITGQVNSRFMRRSPAMRQLGFQEWPAVECLRPLVKYAELVTDPLHVPACLELAIDACLSGRPGPALLDLPIDVQRAQIPDGWLRMESTPPPPLNVDDTSKIGILVVDLAAAKRPVLLIGGGVRSSRAVEALDILAEALRIPLLPTWNALDVVASDHPWYGGRVGTYGGPGRNFAIQNSDLVVAVGCRISGRITGGRPETFARSAKLVVVDVDPGLLDQSNQDRRADVSVRCDAEVFLRELERQWRNARADGLEVNWLRREYWRGRVMAWRDRYDPLLIERPKHEGIDFYAFVRRLSELVNSDAVIVYDCGGNAVVMNHAFRTRRGQRYFSNNGNSPMGFALAGAIGAAMAAPERQVICIIGDGGLQVNIQELQTIAHCHPENLKVFVLNNHCYGITQAFQDTHYAGRHEASGPENYSVPNFPAIIADYGLPCDVLRDPSETDYRIANTLAHKRPSFCVVESPGFHEYYPKIDGWATPIEDMTPRLPRQEFSEQMIGANPLLGWETGEYR